MMKNDAMKKTNVGFVAQEKKSAIPKEFQNIVNENNEFMNWKYGRMTALLWKSCQEMMDEMDKMEAEIKEWKAKAKN